MGAVVGLLAACNEMRIEGEWVEPIPGRPDLVQGFCLEPDGRATSINMSTLQYERWEQLDTLLVLSGKSLGSGLPISFSDTLSIRKLTADSLVLSKGDFTISYHSPE